MEVRRARHPDRLAQCLGCSEEPCAAVELSVDYSQICQPFESFREVQLIPCRGRHCEPFFEEVLRALVVMLVKERVAKIG